MQNSHHTIDTETKQKTDLLCPFQSPTNYPFHNDYYSSCQFKKTKGNKNNKNIFKNERVCRNQNRKSTGTRLLWQQNEIPLHITTLHKYTQLN